jgi:hypothetical protein
LAWTYRVGQRDVKALRGDDRRSQVCRRPRPPRLTSRRTRHRRFDRPLYVATVVVVKRAAIAGSMTTSWHGVVFNAEWRAERVVRLGDAMGEMGTP